MFPRQKDPFKQRFYYEEMLFMLTGRSRRAIQAWFRRNRRSVFQGGDVEVYLKKFSPYFK